MAKKKRKAAGGPDAIAARVASELERRELSVSELAARSGVLRPELSYWLNGRRSLRSDKVARVLEALGLELRGRAGS